MSITGPHDNEPQIYLEQLSSLYEGFLANDMKDFKNGKMFLHVLERDELGSVAEKSFLHLQCRNGLDTLSWAMLGARTVGVDFDERAIRLANTLAQDKKLDAEFLPTNIYHLPQILFRTFDIVYTAYGVLFWLDDLEQWANLVAHYLAPGGTFYLVDYHPIANLFDECFDANGSDVPQLRYPYAHTKYQHYSHEPGRPQFEYRGVTIWNHKLSDITNALTNAGMKIIYTHEHAYMFTQRFEQMDQDQQGRWRWRNSLCQIPLLFSLKATR